MSSEIELEFTGDAKSAVRAMDQVGDGAKDMARDLDGAQDKSRKFGRSVNEIEDGLGNASGKFRDTNDLVSGFADSVGLTLPPQAQLLMGFADMADGLSGLLGPALVKAKAAMRGLNATMRANPILSVIGVVTLLVGAFVLAYQKSETFRKIVDGAMKGIRKAVEWLWEGAKKVFWNLGDAFRALGRGAKKVAETLTTPYRLAFNAIAGLWNNTVGKLSFKVPGWVPGIGGNGFEVPDIPTFANGGRFQGGPMVVGERGPELLVPDGSGTVIPNNQLRSGSSHQTITLRIDGSNKELRDLMRKIVRTDGNGNVNVAFGGRA